MHKAGSVDCPIDRCRTKNRNLFPVSHVITEDFLRSTARSTDMHKAWIGRLSRRPMLHEEQEPSWVGRSHRPTFPVSAVMTKDFLQSTDMSSKSCNDRGLFTVNGAVDCIIESVDRAIERQSGQNEFWTLLRAVFEGFLLLPINRGCEPS